MLTLARDAVAAALEEIKETQDKHYNVECPKCRRQIKIPVKNMRRSQPRPDATV